MIKQFVHDGMVFYWTTAAIRSASEIIGFYFDNGGIPLSIKRHSVYGSHILLWETLNK